MKIGERSILAIVSTTFAIWAVGFVWRSSFVAPDGQRYFCLFDDAMISMRYAWNLAHGQGLVWNHGEHVQGYTNLLMTLIMSLPSLLLPKSAAVLTMQLLGIPTVIAIAFLNRLIAKHVFEPQAAGEGAAFSLLAFIGPIVYYPLAYWSLMGMEAGMLTLLLAAAVLFSIRYRRSQSRRDALLLAAVLGLAFLTRNDSAIFAALIWVYAAGGPRPILRNGRQRRDLPAAMALYGLLAAGQLYFQYAYYGDVLPNTYYLKLTGMPLTDRLANGLGFIGPFLLSSAGLLALSALGARVNSRSPALLMASMAAAAIAYQIYVGGDPWTYWRMLVPVMPMVILLGGLGAIRLVSPPTQPNARIAPLRAVLLVLIALALANVPFVREALFLARPYGADNNKQNVMAAIALSQLTKSDATLGLFWAGAITYYVERPTIDFLGKSDPYIARLDPDLTGAISWAGMYSVPVHNKYDLDYSIKARLPTYVQGFQWGNQDLGAWAETRYTIVNYAGSRLFLLRDSPSVKWAVADSD